MVILQEILKNTNYNLSLFDKKEISILEKRIITKKAKDKTAYYVKCLIRDKEIILKPEEIVRQLFLHRIIGHYGYAQKRILVEKDVYFGSGTSEKRADIVILHKDCQEPYIIVEVKKPNRRDGLQQLKSYCNAEGSPIGVWTNGEEMIVLHREEPNIYANISHIPTADQNLQDVIKELWTVDKLEKENKLKKERLSFKKVILDLEDMVLANAGVDAFDEVFKLIYAKLYDEWAAKNDSRRKRLIHFRIYGESKKELHKKINKLFNSAKQKWHGVFSFSDKIELTANHLHTCASFLQDIKLFNSNLQIIDEAFEYLVTQVSKGAKGQYFTPRHVIDMCIKMLNPQSHEKVVDTAAGSCGFTVHSIFWVFRNSFRADKISQEQREYAGEMVYGIDFDKRAVKIAKALNLIAGDGKSNVYKLNSLDPSSWNDEGRAGLRSMLTQFMEDNEKDDDNQKNFRYFDFDVLFTNPPFAGNINEKSILRNYYLAEKKGKTVSNIGRDILFIERNLQFLKPGGRMAIVLPQGRFNNTQDKFIREFIADKARILAVVGLGVNTFKPHTGTKTSVLFLQKWNDDENLGPLCPKKDDYPIFFAVSEKSGKDNSGDYVYLKNPDGTEKLDKHGHKTVNHDLHNNDGELPDAIAEGFMEFAKKEKMSFQT